MRSFILLPACLHSVSAASSNEESTSLMQKRLLKQMGIVKAEPVGYDDAPPPPPAYDDPEPAYEPPHVCGQWSKWDECTTSCGGGWQTRQYSFLDGVKCNKACPHGDGDKQQQECNTDVPCPMDCKGGWGAYSSCSASCGGGVQSRMYKLSQEAMHGGKACPHSKGAMQDHPCSTEDCEVHCKGHWEDWSECSNGTPEECGPGGSQNRGFKVVIDHTVGGCGCDAVMWGSKTSVDVDASTVDTRSCELPCCPEPCKGSWSEWGKCIGATKLEMVLPGGYGDVSTEMCCGGGMKSKTFKVEKEKVCGGQCCEAPSGAVETSTCCEAPCPVDCVGKWGEFTECCSDCGGGSKQRVFMVSQEAKYGGKTCSELFSAESGDIDVDPCNTQPCPINCKGKWSEYDECTRSCVNEYETGKMSRHWIVTQAAEHGGMKCEEQDMVEIVPCDPVPPRCPIPAVCQWTEYGECDACCSDGVTPIMKYRKWVEITPAQFGGAECKNSPPYGDSEEAECVKPGCPIDCQGSWGKYDTCNAQKKCGDYFCGGGTHAKVYHISVGAQFGGLICPHEDGHKESKGCGEAPCCIHCEGNFTEWGDCCSSCGGGSQKREFEVHVPAQHGGMECKYSPGHIEHQDCGLNPCPVDCKGSWSSWGDCSQSCTDCRSYGAVGQKTRKFTIHQVAKHGGLECPHTDGKVEELTCGENCCPEDCEGSWTEFSECSTSCGNGVTERFYHVTHPEAHGGKPCCRCDGASHTKECDYTIPCPVDCAGDFSSWSQCSDKCGGGKQSAWFIQMQLAQNGGTECEHGQFEQVSRPCNTQECPQMCLGAFTAFGPCDSPCSGGTKTRNFMVFRPATGGGPECPFEHGDVDTAACHEHDCPEGYVCPPEKTCKYSNGLIQVR